jgi:leucyl-tRNA synthetase
MKYHEIKHFSRELRKNQTPFEKLLWNRLRDRQLDGFKFLRQHPLLYDRQGNDLNFFIPDFYCPKTRLAIEIDGNIHDEKQEHDCWREKILTGMKITVIRFRNEDLGNMAWILEVIRDRLRKL